MTIQERIKELRVQKKFTQEGAALTFHMDKSTWSRMESGHREPSVQLIGEICKEWHVSADYLLFGENDTKNQVDLSGLTYPQRVAIREVVNGLRRS